MSRWRVDPDLLEQAANLLGVVGRPISVRMVKQSQLPGFSQGQYFIDDGSSEHYVWILGTLEEEEVNGILFHELTHALQCERLGAKRFQEVAWDDFFKFGTLTGPNRYTMTAEEYNATPLEVEANDNKHLASQVQPLRKLRWWQW
jgi:hypothetical protein